ncbi:MAG: autotransporter outer membrane beta-barrel domain-containing protein [Selenomonadaceae bacterium]|nr:autotransporter outer membrane beta-barrel domain-containing protein [Selenomonadaceae bacterium]
MRKLKHIKKISLITVGLGLLPISVSAEEINASSTSGQSSDNTVVIESESYSVNGNAYTYESDGTTSGDIYGGASDTSTTSRNTVAIADEQASVTGGGYIYGGQSSEGDASNNAVNISAGTIYRYIHAGDVVNGNATGNVINISGGTLNGGWLSGAYVGGNGTATNNVTNISGGNISVEYIEGSWGSGTHTGNKVNITGGNVFGGIISGAWVTSDTEATGNETNISGGAIDNATIAGAYFAGAAGVASGNTVNISGSPTISNSSIYGGWSPYGSATNNTINIYDSPDLSSSTLYAGMASTDDASSGNTLNIHTSGLTAQNIDGFENLNFFLPSNMTADSTVLTLTSSEGTDLSNTVVNVSAPNGTNMDNGTTFTLVENQNGITTSSITNSGIMSEGISINYNLSLNEVSDSDVVTRLTATVGSGSMNPQTKVVSESVIVGPLLANYVTDLSINWLPPEEVGEENKDVMGEQPELANEFRIFGNMGAGSLRTDTGQNSHIDTDNWGMDLGWAKALDYGSAGKLVFAPIVDYGRTKYDSYTTNGIHGTGNASYLAGGMIGRRIYDSGFYVEGSFRYGRTQMDFSSNDMESAGQKVHVYYDATAPCWAGHLHVGRLLRLSKKSTLNVYGMYHHSHQDGMSATLSTGENYTFDAVDSGRFRMGARLTKRSGTRQLFYSGLAYQYEYSGSAQAHYKGYSTPDTSTSGSSFMAELGWQIKPTKNSPWMIDLNATGWVGTQRGVTATMKFKKAF